LIAIEFVFIVGLSYPVATIYVWFRDMQHVLRVALQLLFYLTPIFYQASSVPTRLQPLYRLNPMAPMVDAYRAVLVRGEWPNPQRLLFLSLISFVVLLVGVAWFRRASYRFADEL
jgi:lipopolysaccharide transport system permease protein